MGRELERHALVQSFTEMVALGLTPLQAVHHLEPVSGRFAGELRAIRGALEQGQPLPRSSRLLPPELPALLEAGRKGADLAPMMEGALRYLAAVYGLLRAALLPLYYPLFLLLVLGQLSFVLKRRILLMAETPPLLEVFSSSWFMATIAASALLLSYWIWWRQAPRARANPLTWLVESVLSLVPGLRHLVADSALAIAASSLAVTLRAGVDGAAALRLAGASSRSASLRGALEAAGRAVVAGQPLERAVEQGKMPAPLRGAISAAGDERWIALEAVAQTALDRLGTRARRVSVLAFSAALLLAALCIGGVLLRTYQAVIALPDEVYRWW